MKRTLLSLLAPLFILTAPSAFGFSDVAYTAGAFTTEVSPDSSSLTADSGTGFFVGILGFMDMQDMWKMRAGVIAGKRKTDFALSTASLEYELTVIEAPITGLYMINEMVGFFGGLRVGLVTGDECSSSISTACSSVNADFETMIYAGEVGGHFRFTPNFGAEIAYNIGLSDIEKNTKWDGGLIINGFMIF